MMFYRCSEIYGEYLEKTVVGEGNIENKILLTWLYSVIKTKEKFRKERIALAPFSLSPQTCVNRSCRVVSSSPK